MSSRREAFGRIQHPHPWTQFADTPPGDACYPPAMIVFVHEGLVRAIFDIAA